MKRGDVWNKNEWAWTEENTDLYRGINEFKEGCEPRTNLVKDKNGDLLADSNSILNLVLLRLKLLLKSWKGLKHQALIKFWQNWFKQEEIYYYVLRSTNLLILFELRKNCLSSRQNLLMYLFIKRQTKLIVAVIEEYQCYELQTRFYPIFFSQC
jgi:hypothetical protein